MGFTNIIYSTFNGLLEVYIICFFFSTFAKPKEFKGRNIFLALLALTFVVTLCIEKHPFLNFGILILVIFLIS